MRPAKNDIGKMTAVSQSLSQLDSLAIYVRTYLLLRGSNSVFDKGVPLMELPELG